MARMIAPLFVLSASPALAHPGFHAAPQGAGYAWLGLAILGAGVAAALHRVRA